MITENSVSESGIMTREMWDQRYSAADYVYGTEPEPFFKQEIGRLKPGKLLLPAEGEGRNAVYAAGQGWEVLAFDQSDEGRKKAFRLAREKGVTINYHLGDLETFLSPPQTFDAIALSYVHTSGYKRKLIHRRLEGFLKPGGIMILQGFSTDQKNYTSGGPGDPDLLFTVESIGDDFKEMQILTLEKVVTVMESGEGHKGPGSVIRMVAVKS